jgi:uncharacterized protein YvpB
MNRINDFVATQVDTPLVDAEEGKQETNAKQPALYQTGVPFQPSYQNFTTPTAPSTSAANIDLAVLSLAARIVSSNGSTSPNPSIGTTTSALTAGGTPTQLPNVDTMPCLKQHGNACGTTTLAEIMSYLGVNMSQDDIDSVIRRMDTWTSPQDMINFARQHGLEAEGYNNGSWEQVKAMIDAGHPVQAMVDGDSSVQVTDDGKAGHFSVDGLHYIAITGYGTDPATGEEYVTYHDPNRDDGEQRMSVSDFEKM